jgi:hypothetical protein
MTKSQYGSNETSMVVLAAAGANCRGWRQQWSDLQHRFR